MCSSTRACTPLLTLWVLPRRIWSSRRVPAWPIWGLQYLRGCCGVEPLTLASSGWDLPPSSSVETCRMCCEGPCRVPSRNRWQAGLWCLELRRACSPSCSYPNVPSRSWNRLGQFPTSALGSQSCWACPAYAVCVSRWNLRRTAPTASPASAVT